MPSQSTVERVPSASQELRVYLLGPPQVEVGDGPLPVPRRQVRALLYRLAAQRGLIPREQLCFLLWPDVPESEARRSLSRLLTHLRRALPAPDLVIVSDDCVGLDSQRVWSDVINFIRFSKRKEKVESLRRAADLYRGPLLGGFSLAGSPEFESWLLQQQRDCERRYLDVLITLVEKDTARREYDAAIGYARRYLATDDLAEDMHRRLIALYLAAGNRGAALRQFERCAVVLERELGVRPLPETRAVYESALEGRPSTVPRPDIIWATLPGLDVPLVGRDAACAELSEALSRAQAGRGRVVLLSGEPGIGKSRLMEAFATRLGDQALVLAAASRYRARALPYQSVIEAFRCLPDWSVLDGSVRPVWLAEAARILPELRDLHPDLPLPFPGELEEARTRLLEALSRLAMGLAAGSRSLLLCLDDLHWADSATLDWLVLLARRISEAAGRGAPVLILGTYRTEEQRNLDGLRRDLARMGVLSELRVTGLTSSAVLQIVCEVTGSRSGAPALASRLHRATGGNPFFLLETLRVLREEGQLPNDLANVDGVPLPESVRQAVEARLRRLGPKTRQILEAGAVLGMSFDFDLVRRTAGRDEIETMDALDQAVGRQLLVEQPPGHSFQHALIRQIIELGLGPVRRHLLHRRAARALERIDPGAAARIARHYDLAGEPEGALRHYRRAARQTRDLFAWDEAERIQGRMLGLLDRLDPEGSHDQYLALRGHILTTRAHVRFLQGRLADRDADLDALAALAESGEDDELRLRTVLHRVRYRNLGGHYEQAIAEGEQGLALARRLDDPEAQSRLLAHVGFANYFLGQPQPALVALEAALDLSGEEMDAGMRGRIMHVLGYVHYHLSDYAEALSCQEIACRCSREIGDQNRTAWNLMDVGFLHLKLGRFTRARECLTDSLALARQIAARPAEAYALTLLGDWNLYQGRYAAALDRFQESLPMQVEVSSQHGIVAVEDGAGFALYHLGDLEGARERLRSATDRARSIGHQRHVALALIGLGLVELAAGSPSDAGILLTDALAVARESHCPENVSVALTALAKVERNHSDAAAALDRVCEAAQIARAHDLPTCRVWAELQLGLAYLACGDPQRALEHTTWAVEALPRTHQLWVGKEEVHRAHASVLGALGRTEEAREQARLAEAIIQEKADRIPDPDTRQRYLQQAKPDALELDP